MDGFPNSLEQVEILKDAGIIPSRIVHLNTDLTECIKRAKFDTSSRPENSEPLHERFYLITFARNITVRTSFVYMTNFNYY